VKRDTFYLEYILDEIEVLREMLSGKDIEDYLSDETLKRAVAKTLENIGEIVKNISDEIKSENDEIEWRDIAGLRDIITHRYHVIDHNIIWDICQNRINELEDKIRSILDH